MLKVYPILVLLASTVVCTRGEVELLGRGGATEWGYLDDGSDPGSSWTGTEFDDSGWKRGKGPLGYGDTGLGTEVSYGGDAENKHPKTYFRTSFDVGEEVLEKIVELQLKLIRDDGAVVYLNGKKVASSNVPLRRAIGGNEEGIAQEFMIGKPLPLKAGNNTVAVEVYQAGPTSSDLYMDLGITGFEKGEVPERDFYDDGMAALRRRDLERAVELLKSVPESHPRYVDTMVLLGYQVYAQALGRAEEGLPYVKKAYERGSEERSVLRAYIKTHLMSGVLFDDAAIERELGKPVLPEHEFLVSLPEFGDDSERFSGEELKEDLDYLEHILANCFAYLELRPVDYRAALDTLRSAVKDGLPVNSFEICLAKLISMFCDGHGRVGHHETQYLPRGYSPYLAGSAGDRIFLYDATGEGYLDAEHPYVRSIDGKSIDEWMRVAGFLVVKESPQWHRRGALEMLRYVSYLRAELGLPDEKTIRLTLESEDGRDTVEREETLSRRRLQRRPPFPRGRCRRIGDIGYLLIPSMSSDPAYLADLEEWMKDFRDTKGLVIDVRGNTGGTKSILFMLFPYFMAPDAPMRVVEMSTYRKPMELPKPVPQGFMQSDMSGQPLTSKRWTSDAQRAQVSAFIDQFETEWKLPMEKFSMWHVLALDAGINPNAYYYDKPVIVLHDAGTFSAGDIFVGAFEDHPNTTTMGEASGGGNGWMDTYELPNTGLQVVLCQSAKFRANGKAYDGEGIEPDVEMLATPGDLFGNSDTVLDAALKRLGGER